MRAPRGEHLQEEPGPLRSPGLTPGQIEIAEELRVALRGVDQAKVDRFLEDIDSIVDQDPTPRFWDDS